MFTHNVLNKKFIPYLVLNEFLEESKIFVQEYSCPLCEGILNESIIDKCGHSFCKPCVEVLLDETNICPFSKIEILPQNDYKKTKNKNTSFMDYVFINRAVNAVIEKQNVFCKNKNSKCEWTGKLNERKNHLLYNCEKEPVSCEYSTDCKVQMTKEKLALHMNECPYRTVLCQHCQQYTNFNLIEDHYKICPNFPSICSNGCGISIPFSLIYTHIELECDNTIAECPFMIVGCPFTDIRKELKLHLANKLEDHLKLIGGKIKSLEEITNYQKSTIANIQKENEKLNIENLKTKSLINDYQKEILESINIANKNVENFKLYSIVPLSNIIPNFFSKINLESFKIFKIDEDKLTIKKSQDNLGWYGLSSENISLGIDSLNKSKNKFFTNSNKSKIIINMKILQTNNSCIFFGITFSNLKSPLKNGFYTQTDEDDISYMIYTHNCSLYRKGVSITANGVYEPSQDGDIISIIIDSVNNTISFKRNGVLVIQPTDIEFLSNDQFKNNLKIAVDLTDYDDEVMFLA